MGSYFVATTPLADGSHAVHDRSRCAPGCFPVDGAAEYLGDFLDLVQAVTVARVRYAPVRGCSSCEPSPVTAVAQDESVPLRS